MKKIIKYQDGSVREEADTRVRIFEDRKPAIVRVVSLLDTIEKEGILAWNYDIAGSTCQDFTIRVVGLVSSELFPETKRRAVVDTGLYTLPRRSEEARKRGSSSGKTSFEPGVVSRSSRSSRTSNYQENRRFFPLIACSVNTYVLTSFNRVSSLR